MTETTLNTITLRNQRSDGPLGVCRRRIGRAMPFVAMLAALAGCWLLLASRDPIETSRPCNTPAAVSPSDRAGTAMFWRAGDERVQSLLPIPTPPNLELVQDMETPSGRLIVYRRSPQEPTMLGRWLTALISDGWRRINPPGRTTGGCLHCVTKGSQVCMIWSGLARDGQTQLFGLWLTRPEP